MAATAAACSSDPQEAESCRELAATWQSGDPLDDDFAKEVATRAEELLADAEARGDDTAAALCRGLVADAGVLVP